MNNRLDNLFNRKKSNILSVFLTAGYPHLDDTVSIVCELDKHGVDMVEIGIPFSDPMADGPVIQQSSQKAIENGITLPKILKQVEMARKKVSHMPFVLMGYINNILQYGFENFFNDASSAGVDGVIIPDLPFEEYVNQFLTLSRKYNLPVVMLITPETSEERIRLIDDYCEGFIYMVSSASTTGTRDRFSEKQLDYFRKIDSLSLKHPRLIGFGISNHETYIEACKYSSGVIVGSLFIKCLKNESSIESAVSDLIGKLLNKIN